MAFFRVKLLNGQSWHIEVDRYALAVRREITDEEFCLGVKDGIGDLDTGEVEDIDRRSDMLP